MEELQEKIFAETEELVANFSILRVVLYSLASSAIIVVLLIAFSLRVDVYTVSLAVVVSFIYVYLRDLIWKKKAYRLIHRNYKFLKQKRPGMKLYVPLFSGTRSGIYLKKAAIFYDNKHFYIEAFQQTVLSRGPKDSITLKFGYDFDLGQRSPGFNENIVNYQGKLLNSDYNFSVINNKELIDLMENNEGEQKS